MRKLSWEKGKIENAIFIEKMFFNQIFTEWSSSCGQFTQPGFHYIVPYFNWLVSETGISINYRSKHEEKWVKCECTFFIELNVLEDYDDDDAHIERFKD